MIKIGIISFLNLDILDNGGKIRTYNVAKELSREHKVFLLMPRDKKYKLFGINNLHISRINIQNKNYFKKYLSFIFSGHKIFREAEIDLLICEFSWTIPIGIIISRLLKIPLLLNEHNLEYLRSIQLKKYFRFLYSVFLEFILIQDCDYVLSVSKYEKKILEKTVNKKVKCILLPNGTPTKPSDVELEKKEIYRKSILNKYNVSKDKLVSIFIGDLSYSPNIRALNILNNIANRCDEILKIFVIGKNVNFDFEKKYNDLIFTGYVKNIKKFLYGADFTIIPIESGGGTNLKIYEALSVGLPIITSKYAIQNIEVNKNSLVLLADGNYEEKVKSMINILNNNIYQRKINNSYNWDGIIKKFLRILKEQKF